MKLEWKPGAPSDNGVVWNIEAHTEDRRYSICVAKPEDRSRQYYLMVGPKGKIGSNAMIAFRVVKVIDGGDSDASPESAKARIELKKIAQEHENETTGIKPATA